MLELGKAVIGTRGKPLLPSYWAYPGFEKPVVYFIRADCGPIKIGLSTNPGARIYNMQSEAPSRLVFCVWVEGGKQLERAYHERFAEHRLWGEWFSPEPVIEDEIAKRKRAAKRRGSIKPSGYCLSPIPAWMKSYGKQ